MKYEFDVYQMEVENHRFWVAKSRVLNGCVGQGETSKDAIKELEDNETEWLETAKKYGIPIPKSPIRKPKVYSGKISLRLSPYEHQRASENASMLGISVNQYFDDAITAYNSSFDTEISVKEKNASFQDQAGIQHTG